MNNNLTTKIYNIIMLYEKILLSFSFFISVVCAQNKDYPIHAVPFTQVVLTDNFWLPRIKVNADGYNTCIVSTM